VPFRVQFDGLKAGAKAQLTVLSADSPWAHNTPAHKDAVITTTKTLRACSKGTFEFKLPNLSVAVLVAENKKH
jgi:alpha-N-arabinofuranosidase